MSQIPFRVLFLCTGNSARSVLSEALLDKMSDGRFKAYSAGSIPKGKVHPCTLELLSSKGHDITGFRSKSWDEFSMEGALRMDLVATVCGNAANETCPVWIGTPLQIHWGFEDPAAVTGNHENQMKLFSDIYDQIESLLTRVVALPLETMSKGEQQEALQQLNHVSPKF
jgi:arsenate reductase